MNLVEESYYTSEEYEVVKLIDLGDKCVRIKTNNKKFVPNIGNVSIVEEKNLEDFKREFEPADINVSAPKSEVDYEITNRGD